MAKIFLETPVANTFYLFRKDRFTSACTVSCIVSSDLPKTRLSTKTKLGLSMHGIDKKCEVLLLPEMRGRTQLVQGTQGGKCSSATQVTLPALFQT